MLEGQLIVISDSQDLQLALRRQCCLVESEADVAGGPGHQEQLCSLRGKADLPFLSPVLQAPKEGVEVSSRCVPLQARRTTSDVTRVRPGTGDQVEQTIHIDVPEQRPCGTPAFIFCGDDWCPL